MTINLLPERIRSKIKINPDTSCWEWTACRNASGYGLVRWESRLQAAHRVVYQILVGEYPPRTEHDHLCRVRHCVNPAHGEPVTPRENNLRSDGPAATRARYAAVTHCPQGHPYDGANLYVRPQGGRQCRTCKRASVAAYRGKRREAV